MATSSFRVATASAAPAAEDARRSSNSLHLGRRANSAKVSFRLSHRPKLRFLSKAGSNYGAVVRAQSKEVAVGAPSKDAVSSIAKSDVSLTKPQPSPLASEESISEFISQVTNLIKLVDSKDIVELQMKQLDCEVLIRKKEALAPPPPSPAVAYAQPPQYALPPAPVHSPAAAAASSLPPPPPSPAKPQVPKSSLPPLKSPMAGTFYRSPAPGEPPFIKVGDKVQKGQVVCIIEAMKLMNDIEADQSGTVVEILAEDAKPVSFDTPLLVIQT